MMREKYASTYGCPQREGFSEMTYQYMIQANEASKNKRLIIRIIKFVSYLNFSIVSLVLSHQPLVRDCQFGVSPVNYSESLVQSMFYLENIKFGVRVPFALLYSLITRPCNIMLIFTTVKVTIFR